uniref:Kininogen 1 n=1 Tax=Bubo bubo TaxID=30461 RepID=A0A8C0FNE5_BUBBB
MKPFILLALCCSFFSSTATPLPFEFSDCDDPDVFKAVDTALKKYNGDQATGNQFALYMVMEAKRTAGPNTQFYVKYRIQETTCATEENKLWQDCDYKVPAEAAVLHEVLYFLFASFPAAPKIPLAEAPCLGCFHPISTDSSEVSEILKQAIEKFNRHSAEPALFKLVEIKEAKRQVVAGWNYIIKYEIEETNCSKDQFQDLTPECKPTSRDPNTKCSRRQGFITNCFSQPLPTLNLLLLISEICSFLSVEDTVLPGIHAGCPKTIPKDSPELKELLKVSMEKYNLDSNDEFYYKGGEIEAATVQAVAGQKYHLIFAVQKTNCSKKEFEKLHEDCEAMPDSVSHNDVANCNVPNRQINLHQKLRPPGFTPFRSFAAQQEPHEISCSDINEEERQKPDKEMRKDGGQEPEGEGEPELKYRHKHGQKHRHEYKKDHESDKRHSHEIGCGHRTSHGCGHKKHSKHGKHKHPNPKSSEESNERGFNQNETLPSSSAETAPELVNPGVARKETSIPAESLILPDTSLFNGLPDRPESPLPRCPGKPWKQIMDLPAPSSFTREFRNEDLLPSATEDINPATENSTPPQNKDLDLSDALL